MNWPRLANRTKRPAFIVPGSALTLPPDSDMLTAMKPLLPADPLRRLPVLPGKRFHIHRLILAAACVAALAAIGYKATRMPEWTVLAGSEKERTDICRSVYMKAPWRASWSLARLLADPSATVRIASIEALTRRPDIHARLKPLLVRLAADSDAAVRARALEYLIRRPDDADLSAWMERVSAELEIPAYRHQQPGLLRQFVTTRLKQEHPGITEWALRVLETDPDQDPSPFQPLLTHPSLLKPFRRHLLESLDAQTWTRKGFTLAALTAMDGCMRGDAAVDWETPDAAPGTSLPDEALERFSVEAEWAYDIQPNFQIDTHDGEPCLDLGEGAGGSIAWMGKDNSSVDIGTAFFPFTAAKAGTYQAWMRFWASDKCGNTIGMKVDETVIGEFDDYRETYGTWHWSRLSASFPLEAGPHRFTIKAWEDGLFVDKLVILPATETFDAQNLPPFHSLFVSNAPSTISFTAELQQQPRNTTQKIIVWTRRNSTAIPGGRLTLTLPPPFRILHASEADVVFAPQSPIARTTFLVQVPKDAPGGEVEVKAELCVDRKILAMGRMILGVPFDWYTTGPLATDDPRCLELKSKSRLDPVDLRGWTPYPPAGYDRYRRFDFQRSYKDAIDKFIFLYTEIEVDQDETYCSLLNVDDTGCVTIDGQQVSACLSPGPAEGRLNIQPCRLDKGRHKVFAWAKQSSAPIHHGPDAVYQSPNNWTLKWLLRKTRHEPAPGITGPMLNL